MSGPVRAVRRHARGDSYTKRPWGQRRNAITIGKDSTPCSEAHAAETDALDLLEALAIKGLGPVSIRRLLNRFGMWGRVREAGRTALREAGLRSDVIDALCRRQLQYDPAEQLRKAQDLAIKVVPFTCRGYPSALRVFEDAPPLLFVKGDLLERDAVAVAIVGTRRASVYGRMQAERLAFGLAQAGFTIVSGLARGVDAAAHQGALKGGGRTIAVLGNGLAEVYPKEHGKLAEQVVGSGALVSELLPNTAPTARNFPARNRIIAALSLGVVVVEAPLRSGALITARLGGEMGKEVFAFPGDVGRPQTRGAHQLIRDGAKLVESVEDILEELGPLERPVRMADGHPPLADPRALTLNSQERAIYDLLSTTPKDIDEITREAGLSPANVASTLMVLELKHLAVQEPGKLYLRAGAFRRNVE